MLTLHTYWRSSCSYRVRIALHLKGLEYESRPVHLVRNGGEQHSRQYRIINPQGLVPALEHDSLVLTQSLAIVEYLEEAFPHPPLLPADAAERARVRGLAMLVACEIQPLANLGTQQFLANTLEVDEGGREAWTRHHIHKGFMALEQRLSSEGDTGLFCHGDTPGLADLCLVPQMYNARRIGCQLDTFPTLTRIDAACRAIPAFAAAAPEAQPDAP